MPSLNETLEDLGELIATNLQSKGVNASPNDGLTTLANKVLQINTGGSSTCYNVQFTENSDNESSGSLVDLEILARYQYQPLTNTTLTVTGSDNSTHTATTDNNGIATFHINNISADTTYTCTYQGSTTTINVTYGQYLFYDACANNSKLNKYESPISIYNSSLGGVPTMEYDSTENAYALYGSSTNDYVIFPIPKLNGESNFTFSCEIKLNTSSSNPQIGLGVMPNESQLTGTYSELVFIYRYNASQVNAYAQRRRRTTSSSISTGRVNHAPTNWLRIKIVYNSSNGFTATWEEVSNGTILKTYTGTVSAGISDRHYGIYMRCYSNNSYKGFIRNIKAERNV